MPKCGMSSTSGELLQRQWIRKDVTQGNVVIFLTFFLGLLVSQVILNTLQTFGSVIW